MTLTNLEKGAGAQGGAAVRLGKVHFSYGEAPFVFDVEFAISKITAIMG
jgi:thiamine transport system ATP-binding protein